MPLERIQPQLMDEFIWYNDTNDASIEETIAPGTFWKFKSLRMHFSTVQVSANVLRVYVSSVRLSGFSQVLISRVMNGSYDYFYNTYSHEIWLFSDDHIVVSFINSIFNGVGIIVNGWAVQQEQ